jgi:pyruvate dehydrogenase E2 component (dihydrolipoamide acetyltransferase)
MSEIEKVTVPDLGDFDAVDVIEVLVTAGDDVSPEDSLITLESDKATMDVPSPIGGRIQEVKVKAGDKVSKGDVILTVRRREAAAEPDAGGAKEEATGSAVAGSADDAEGAARASEGGEAPTAERPDPGTPPAVAPAPSGRGGERSPVGEAQEEQDASTQAYASPAVRRYARELGVDLGRVRGTGRKNRILREDVQTFVQQRLTAPSSPSGGSLPEMPVIDFSKFGDIERRPLSRIQRIAGPHLHRSWLHVPHVTQHDEADITELESFRQAHKAEAEKRGVRLTPLAFLMKATVGALREHPVVNASLDPDGEHVILKRYYHLGIAVDTEDGLIVPVIRNVDAKGLFDLAEELATVSSQAREGKLKPDQLRGASFTVSSLGGIGGGHFTPIVNAPEVAILGVGRSRLGPVWNGEQFEPRLLLPLSLSYDHRVIDGALAVRFTTTLARLLSDLRRLLL